MGKAELLNWRVGTMHYTCCDVTYKDCPVYTNIVNTNKGRGTTVRAATCSSSSGYLPLPRAVLAACVRSTARRPLLARARACLHAEPGLGRALWPPGSGLVTDSRYARSGLSGSGAARHPNYCVVPCDGRQARAARARTRQRCRLATAQSCRQLDRGGRAGRARRMLAS